MAVRLPYSEYLNSVMRPGRIFYAQQPVFFFPHPALWCTRKYNLPVVSVLHPVHSSVAEIIDFDKIIVAVGDLPADFHWL